MDLSSLLTMLKDGIGSPWPLVGGGLAGAMFTRMAASRAAKKLQERIKLQQSVVEYSLPEGRGALGELRVSFNGSEYERLSLRELAITNGSSQSELVDNSVLITLGAGATVVKCVVEQAPDTPPLPMLESDGLPDGVFRWRVGRLLPGDWVRIRMLTSQASQFDVSYRGDPRVKVIRSGESESIEPMDREIRLLGGIVTGYLIFSLLNTVVPGFLRYLLTTPIAVVQCALLVMGAQSAFRLLRVLMLAVGESRKGSTQDVNNSGSIGQQVLVGPGTSNLSLHITDGRQPTSRGAESPSDVGTAYGRAEPFVSPPISRP